MSSDTSIRPIPRFKISDSVSAEIEQMIRAGTYQVGDKLPSERVLSLQFGVGRSSMREALRSLEARGLVSVAHGLGVYVNEKPTDNGGAAPSLLLLAECTVPELFEVRRALECPAVALAARRVTPSEAAALNETLVAMSREDLSDSEYIEKDAEFHLAICHATHNALLIRIYESTRHLFVEYSSRVISLPGRRKTAQRGHADIVEAIVKRRPQAAQKAMSAHLEAVEREIVERLDTAAG